MFPVAAAAPLTYPAPSASRLQLRPDQPTSNSSVSGLGGVILLPEVVPKKPRTTSPAAVVVTEGATIDRVCDVEAPLCESTGEVPSIPLTSRMAPATEA